MSIPGLGSMGGLPIKLRNIGLGVSAGVGVTTVVSYFGQALNQPMLTSIAPGIGAFTTLVTTQGNWIVKGIAVLPMVALAGINLLSYVSGFTGGGAATAGGANF